MTNTLIVIFGFFIMISVPIVLYFLHREKTIFIQDASGKIYELSSNDMVEDNLRYSKFAYEIKIGQEVFFGSYSLPTRLIGKRIK